LMLRYPKGRREDSYSGDPTGARNWNKSRLVQVTARIMAALVLAVAVFQLGTIARQALTTENQEPFEEQPSPTTDADPGLRKVEYKLCYPPYSFEYTLGIQYYNYSWLHDSDNNTVTLGKCLTKLGLAIGREKSARSPQKLYRKESATSPAEVWRFTRLSSKNIDHVWQEGVCFGFVDFSNDFLKQTTIDTDCNELPVGVYPIRHRCEYGRDRSLDCEVFLYPVQAFVVV